MPWKNSTNLLRDAGFWTFFYELFALGSHLCLGEATRTWQSLVRRVSPRLLLGNFQSQVMVLPEPFAHGNLDNTSTSTSYAGLDWRWWFFFRRC